MNTLSFLNKGRTLILALAILCSPRSGLMAHGGSHQPAPPLPPIGPLGPLGPVIGLPIAPAAGNLFGLFGKGGRMNQIAVLMVNFENYRKEPFTAEEAHAGIMSASDAWYREVSYGKQAFSGKVFGWYELDMKLEDCNDVGAQLGEMQDKAIKAADRDVDYGKYGRIIIIYPECGLGWGSVGTRQIKVDDSRSPLEFSVSWMRTLDPRVVLHELGHNLSLQHASSYRCKGGVLTSDCEDEEYGDFADAMGSAARHFNAFHKRKLGWIGDSQFPKVSEKKGIYRYLITPMELAGGIKGVRVPMTPGTDEKDPSGLDSEFVLELRRKIGFDESLPEAYVDGLMVHIPFKSRHGDSSFEHTHILDMDPEGSSMVLAPGKSWTSPNERVTLTVGKLTEQGLEVTVTLDYPDSKSWWDVAMEKAGDFFGGLFGSARRAVGGAPVRPAPQLDDMRAAGLPTGSANRIAASSSADSTRFSSDGSEATRLARIPGARLNEPVECSSPYQRLPSALRARFDEEAFARGIYSSPVGCLTPGEYLAHRTATERRRKGDPKGAAEAFTWEGYTVLAAERALGR